MHSTPNDTTHEEKGFITNESNPNCRYLVGETECTEKTLADNGFI